MVASRSKYIMIGYVKWKVARRTQVEMGLQEIVLTIFRLLRMKLHDVYNLGTTIACHVVNNVS
jgi:hypothetical protein